MHEAPEISPTPNPGKGQNPHPESFGTEVMLALAEQSKPRLWSNGRIRPESLRDRKTLKKIRISFKDITNS
jgi:hypothetical protein